MVIQNPNLRRSLVNKLGLVTSEWISFFTQFGTPATPLIAITSFPTGSTYTAKEPGNLILAGGTLTAVTLHRGVSSVALPIATRIIPLEIADFVTIAFSVAPTSVQFWPRY